MACSTAAIQSSHPPGLDDEICALTLQLEEIQIQKDGFKGKEKLGAAADSNAIAASIYEAEIRKHLAFVTDLMFAHSMACANHTDGDAIAEIIQDERQAERDRDLASGMFQEPTDCSASTISTINKEGSLDTEVRSQLSGDICKTNQLMKLADATLLEYEQCQAQLTRLLVGNNDVEAEIQAGPSVSYAERQLRALQQMSERTDECVSCRDSYKIGKTVKAPCGHVYCLECMKQIFMRASKDESLFPPRCCKQPLALGLVSNAMTTDELQQFESAQLEFTTENRVYCSNVSCSRFIDPSAVDHRGCASCKLCQTLTCAHCKNAFHDDECSEDPELLATLAVANARGWKRCFRCHVIVDLIRGCNHITCRCGAEFCYQCSAIWKTCRCDQWQEEHLLNRVDEVVDREAPFGILPIERARRVQQVREELLEQHECGHPGRFERVEHGGRRGFACEMCDARHWKYILRCRRCHVQVCEDCRRHRVR